MYLVEVNERYEEPFAVKVYVLLLVLKGRKAEVSMVIYKENNPDYKLECDC